MNLAAYKAFKVTITTAVVLVCNILVPASTLAEDPRQVQACETLSEDLSTMHQAGKFNGLAVIAQKGKILCSVKRGYALAFERVPFTEQTRFRIASITKQFTATTILRLAEDGRIDLDAPLKQYLAYFDGKPAAQIPIRHLMDHSSGIVPDINFPFLIDTRREGEKFAQAVVQEDLVFEPGSKFEYNNTAYKILGAIIEKVTGLDYGSAVEEIVLKPIGLENTGTVAHGEPIDGLALGYMRSGDQPAKLHNPYEYGQPYSAGMMYSTANDLIAWNEALHQNKIFKESKTYEELTNSRLFIEVNFGESLYSAYGLFNEIDIEKKIDSISHYGYFGGFTSSNRYFPKYHFTVIIFNNITVEGNDYLKLIDKKLLEFSKIFLNYR
ncbi:MAG: serine hydrolase domain-containing protein [Pseudomonadota bacterium]